MKLLMKLQFLTATLCILTILIVVILIVKVSSGKKTKDINQKQTPNNNEPPQNFENNIKPQQDQIFSYEEINKNPQTSSNKDSKSLRNNKEFREDFEFLDRVETKNVKFKDFIFKKEYESYDNKTIENVKLLMHEVKEDLRQYFYASEDDELPSITISKATFMQNYSYNDLEGKLNHDIHKKIVANKKKLKIQIDEKLTNQIHSDILHLILSLLSLPNSMQSDQDTLFVLKEITPRFYGVIFFNSFSQIFDTKFNYDVRIEIEVINVTETYVKMKLHQKQYMN